MSIIVIFIFKYVGSVRQGFLCLNVPDRKGVVDIVCVCPQGSYAVLFVTVWTFSRPKIMCLNMKCLCSIAKTNRFIEIYVLTWTCRFLRYMKHSPELVGKWHTGVQRKKIVNTGTQRVMRLE